MRDDKNVPSDTSKEDKTNTGGATEKSITDLTGGKFKSPEDLAKAYKELETKLGEQGEEVKQVREFMSVAQPVFDVIRNDENIFKTIDSKLRNEPEIDSKKNDTETTKQEEIGTVTRDMLRMQFENRHNFSKLSASEQAKLRKAIGNEIFELTGKDINAVDLRRLSPVLEKAYTLAKSGIEDESTREAIAAAEKADDGAISSLPSSGGKAETALTSEEAEVATKLGLSRDEYVSGKKK